MSPAANDPTARRRLLLEYIQARGGLPLSEVPAHLLELAQRMVDEGYLKAVDGKLQPTEAGIRALAQRPTLKKTRVTIIDGRLVAGRGSEAYILKQPPRKPKPRPPPDIEEKIDEALRLLHEGRLRQAAAALLRPAERLGMGKKAYKLLEEPTASAVAGLIKALREKLADTQHGTGKSRSPRRGEHPPGRR